MEENSKDAARLSLDKEIMGTTNELNQPSQQKPGIQMALHQQEHYQLGLKETEKVGWDEGRLSDFLDSIFNTGWDPRDSWP